MLLFPLVKSLVGARRIWECSPGEDMASHTLDSTDFVTEDWEEVIVKPETRDS